MKIHAYATEAHYARHITPIFEALPKELQGEKRYGEGASDRNLAGKDFVLTAALRDAENCTRNRVIYVEHGAGQSYLGAPSRFSESYPHKNSRHPEHVVGYISPRQSMADDWGRPAVAVGCPAIDRHVGNRTFSRNVVITFHWDAPLVSDEARSALPHWEDHLHSMIRWLTEQDFDVWGHGHPRHPWLPGIWRNLGIPFNPDIDELLPNTALLIADNTSVMYEAAALDIPVLTLNAPWYRKDVHHGLRFWDAVPGQQVDTLEDFLSVDFQEYVFGDPTKEQRLAAACAAYDAPADGKASRRAAEWLVEKVS